MCGFDTDDVNFVHDKLNLLPQVSDDYMVVDVAVGRKSCCIIANSRLDKLGAKLARESGCLKDFIANASESHKSVMKLLKECLDKKTAANRRVAPSSSSPLKKDKAISDPSLWIDKMSPVLTFVPIQPETESSKRLEGGSESPRQDEKSRDSKSVGLKTNNSSQVGVAFYDMLGLKKEVSEKLSKRLSVFKDNLDSRRASEWQKSDQGSLSISQPCSRAFGSLT
jgi:hypothetical protein